jgi:hypothetical protein
MVLDSPHKATFPEKKDQQEEKTDFGRLPVPTFECRITQRNGFPFNPVATFMDPIRDAA